MCVPELACHNALRNMGNDILLIINSTCALALQLAFVLLAVCLFGLVCTLFPSLKELYSVCILLYSFTSLFLTYHSSKI